MSQFGENPFRNSERRFAPRNAVRETPFGLNRRTPLVRHCTMRADSTGGVQPQENQIYGQMQKNSLNSVVMFISFSVSSHINDFFKIQYLRIEKEHSIFKILQ